MSRARRPHSARRPSRVRFDYTRPFDLAVARHLLRRVEAWPEDPAQVRALLRYAEGFLRVDERVLGFHAFGAAPTPNDAPMDAALASALRDLASISATGQPLTDAIDDAAAHALWDQLKDRLNALPSTPENYTALSAWELFELVVIVAASGMTYTKGLSGADLSFEVSEQPTSWFQGVELLLVSLWKLVTVDARSLLWLARQPLERGLKGMCRHYSLVVQLLFHAACRALDRHHTTHVLTISGTHELLTRYDHAWTWFVDEAEDMIIPVDLTGADWLYDRRMAASIFNQGFDALRFTNASSLLHTLMTQSLTSPAGVLDAAQVRALLPRLVDVETVHGQAVLCNLLRQNLMPPDLRERMTAHLLGRPEAQGTARALGPLLRHERGDGAVAAMAATRTNDDTLHDYLSAMGVA